MSAREQTIVERSFREDFDFPEWKGAPAKSVMIAGLPRTGSTALCLALWRTGACGAPLEYFNLGGIVASTGSRPAKVTGAAYLHSLWRRRTSPNGVFAFKMFLNDYRDLMDNDESLLAVLRSTHTIFISRLDRLSQAVSYARAVETQQWFFDDPPLRPATYSRSLMMRALSWIEQQENQWGRLFTRTGCTPLRLFYEELQSGQDLTGRVLDFIGEPPSARAEVSAPSIHVQSDDVTADWKRRFLSGE